ncbi:MAG: SIMPL domain-containing protein [Ruminococcus sp.]
MGKLVVEGLAIDRFKPDLMTIRFKLIGHAKTTESAIENMLQQYHALLDELKKIGLKAENICLEDDSVEQDFRDSQDHTTKSIRKISVETLASTQLSTILLQLISDSKFQIQYDISFSFSDESKIHKEMLKKAIKNSRYKATLIAEELQQKVVGMENVNLSRYSNGNLIKSISLDDTLSSIFQSDSERVALPWKEFRESIEITWLTE